MKPLSIKRPAHATQHNTAHRQIGIDEPSVDGWDGCLRRTDVEEYVFGSAALHAEPGARLQLTIAVTATATAANTTITT